MVYELRARIAPSLSNQCPTCCPLRDNLASPFLYKDPFNPGGTIPEIMGRGVRGNSQAGCSKAFAHPDVSI
ncbi:hypothetical protein AFK68_31305 [Hydrocoleum sp. CS-953]|nr:hypothetical protein AFK68_31305 [Hydrocoleum sp. CS-953]